MTAIMSDPPKPFFADATPRPPVAEKPPLRAGDAAISLLLPRAGGAELDRNSGQEHHLILHRTGPRQAPVEASARSPVHQCGAVASGPGMATVRPRGRQRARVRAAPARAGHRAKSRARSVRAARPRAGIRTLPRVAGRLDAWPAELKRLPGKRHGQEVAAQPASPARRFAGTARSGAWRATAHDPRRIEDRARAGRQRGLPAPFVKLTS